MFIKMRYFIIWILTVTCIFPLKSMSDDRNLNVTHPPPNYLNLYFLFDIDLKLSQIDESVHECKYHKCQQSSIQF